MDEANNEINFLENKEAKKPPMRTRQEKGIQKSEDIVRSLWDNFKCSSILIIGVPEGEEEEEQEIRNLFEKVMKESFINLMKKIDMQVQEAQRVPNKMDPKKPTPRHS